MPSRWNLDTPLLALSPRDLFTLRDACNGVHVFGAIGSGKTSGSGKALASAYLRAGMGGLVLCAKPEEVGLWISYCKANGRANSVIVFDETQGYNFIAHELARQGAAGLGNVNECIMKIVEASDAATGAGGRTSSEPFWDEAIRQLLTFALPAIYSAFGNVTVNMILDFVVSAATKAEQYTDEQWAQRSFAAKVLRRAVDDPTVPMADDARDAVLSYWFREYTAIPEKTRGNILVSLSTKLGRFRAGRLRSCFCDKTTIVPELLLQGGIVICAMPALTWNEEGIIGQQLFKYMTQRTIESRNGLDPSQRERPVFLFADESQYFTTPSDEAFLSTCRGSRCCVVFMTQNLPAYYARFGKDKTDAADGLVGKFNTQIFHLNADNRTNQFASQLIGRGIQHRATQGGSAGRNWSRGMNEGGSANASKGSSSNSGSSFSANGGGGNYSAGSNASSGTGQSWGANVGSGHNQGSSWSTAETMDNLVESNYFSTGLRTGGPASNGLVDAVWFKAGARFYGSGGSNVLRVTFKQ